jgi:eukaryotic-like serine/threonine-protein kinase
MADAEAYRLYRAGRKLLAVYSKESTEEAIRSFKAALNRDSRYAEAYTGIAEAWFTMAAFGWMPPEQAYQQAEAAAKEAIKINPRVSDAHRMLANLYSMREGRLDLAEEHYQQAIEYDPSNVMALSWLAMEYAYQGRFKEALTAIGKAQELDRFSPLVTFYYGGIKYLSGDYVEGETHAEKVVVDMQTPLALAYLLLGASHLCGNKVAEARQALEEGLHRPNSPTWALAYARMEGLLAVCDLRENRRAAYRQALKAMQAKYAHDHMYAYPLAVASAQDGDTATALGWLHKAVEKRSFGWQEIRFDPFLEKLRAEPGFKELLKKLPIRPKEQVQRP